MADSTRTVILTQSSRDAREYVTAAIQIPADVKTLTFGIEADADDQLVVTGGDFTLLAGGILLLKYKKSLLRWFEVGRYWPSKTHVDPTPTPRNVTLADLGGGREVHYTLLAAGAEIAF